MILFRRDGSGLISGPKYDFTSRPWFFGTAALEGTGVEGSDLVFATADQPDKGSTRFCRNESACYDVSVGIGAESGQMFIFADHAGARLPSYSFGLHVADSPDHRVEVSAADPDGSLRVHQDVLVEFSAEAPECSDFPDKDADRFRCLFLGEWHLAEQPQTPQSLRDALPGLVQPSDNYSLVLAEEFNGATEMDGCEHGMNTLNPAIWNFDSNPCDNRDTDLNDNALCVNVVDGHFAMRIAEPPGCKGSLKTTGNFTYKYGYIEVKYRIQLTSMLTYTNFQLSIGDHRLSLSYKFNDYGGPDTLDSYEKVARTVGTVINLFEYLPVYRHEVSHQWINHSNYTTAGDTRRYRSSKDFYYRTYSCHDHRQCFCPNNCRTDSWVTMTKGLEWTPRGYRTFIKVDGVHDDLVAVPKSWVKVEKVDPYETFEDQDQFFEYLIDGDDSSILEQVAISHIPLELNSSAWGNTSSNNPATEMQVDYIRVFQPDNKYLDMEPVYK